MFYDCGKDGIFVEFEVPESNQYYKSIDGILYTKDGSTLVSIPRGKTFENSTYIMPDTVTNLGELSFSRNKNISTVIISDNLIIEEDTSIEKIQAGFINYGNSLALAIYVYSPVIHYGVKDTNPNYTTGNRIVSQTHEFGDTQSGSFLLTKDGTELVAMPCQGTGMFRMLPNCVTTIRKNALYMWDHIYDGQPFNITNGMYSDVYFRINKDTTNIDSEQLRYINWLAKDTTGRAAMHLQIQGGINSKYEIVDNQYVEK